MPVFGREWNQFACAEITSRLVLWNTPILNHFHRVGRTLVATVPEAPFPSDLPRSAIFGSALEMIQFINVLLANIERTSIFYSAI